MNESPVHQSLPKGACDCHTHVFLEASGFPMAPSRRYTPPPASIEALSALHDGLGIERVVVVQASVYGTDNAAVLEALRVLGPARARGVVGLDADMKDVTDAALDALTWAGVRGVRVNLEIDREGDVSKASAQLRRTAERIAPWGWHVQVYASLPLLAGCSAVIAELLVPVVLDHYAGARASFGIGQPGLDAVLELVESGKAYVKLSAPYRQSDETDYGDLAPLARRFIRCNPDRMLWGSDWPHPQPGVRTSALDVHPPFDVDNRQVLEQLREWSANDEIFRKILVRNPDRLYGFGD